MFAHNITIENATQKISLRCNGQRVARTSRALKLHEPPLLPVYYIPRDDVDMTLLKGNTHKTVCPFKGEARYYDLQIGEDTYRNAAWTYDSPHEGVLEIKGFIAFYDSVAALEFDETDE